MKTLNKGAAAGRIFYPPGWRMYCLGFGAGLVVATPGLVAGQTDDATISGVAAFFGFTVGVWLAISLSLFLFSAFAMYLERVAKSRGRLAKSPGAAECSPDGGNGQKCDSPETLKHN